MYPFIGTVYIKLQEIVISEITELRSYWNYSKATICRHMKKNIGDIEEELGKHNHGRPPKLSVRQVRKILRQTKHSQEEMGKFCVKRVMVKTGIPASISEETVRRVLWKCWPEMASCFEERNPDQKWLEIELYGCSKCFLETFCKLLRAGCRILFG